MANDQNLTGEQIENILDSLLYSALEPIVKNCSIFDLQVCYLISLITKNKKRKISSIDRNQAVSLLVHFLAEVNVDRKLSLIREAKIERSFVHVFLRRITEEYKDFCEQYRQYLVEEDDFKRNHLSARLDVISKSLGCKTKGRLYFSFVSCADYLKLFYEYRNHVIGHYVKLVSTQAKSYVKSNPAHQYDFLDVRQNCLRNVAIAIDKYDSIHGAITSYIKWWILNAQTCSTSEHEYGIAFTVPQSQKKKVATTGEGAINFSVSLDTALSGLNEDDDDSGLHSILGDVHNVHEEIEKEQETELIRYFAKRADIRGCARLSLDIGEYITPTEIRKMKEQMQKEGLS